MTDTDELPDRDELRLTAVARVRRGRLLAFAVLLLCALAVPVGVLSAGGGEWSPGRIAVVLIPVGVITVTLAVLYPLTRQQDRNPPLSFGADSATRRAVRQALRTGEVADARIDALARDTATRTLRNTWQLPLLIVVMALQVIAAVLRTIGNADPLQIGPSALIVVVFGASIAVLVVNRRRSRSYLSKPPPAATSSAQR